MSIDWSFNLNLDKVAEAAKVAAPLGAAKGMEHIRGVAVALTPYESGDLAGSATVTVDGDEATVTFAGPYARRQHEELTWRHEKGQAKYLEQPMHTEKPVVMDIIAHEVRKAL
ncbi:minor capsid protein [Paenarthrobacter sp. JL.01a]|uniref:minor capsid protein n=1 Tax=Paenarthrobacter sp. JL.01a TaxID=2979324 RepID=UPI0021C66360|nr:minor capsid protein [Paenarthrobacter sp. JL.01a]UXM90949.1 minor capsid protein [Paenarthrobacter sp. JL.01a]